MEVCIEGCVLFFLVSFFFLPPVIRQVCVSSIASRMIEEPRGGGGKGGRNKSGKTGRSRILEQCWAITLD